ncbi:MAG: chromosomal replication initiator protein DnaA [Moraxella sp.]|nr:chromosomal replication initiator protein DnaA [Moraxella sp.]
MTTETTFGLWQSCLSELKLEMEDIEFNQWLLPLVAEELEDALVLTAINPFFVKHIEKKYLNKIKELVLKHSLGRISVVKLQVMASVTSSPAIDKPTKKQKPSTRIVESDQINDAYTFDAFVKGKSNQLAYNVCYDMAKKAEQSTYISLFIYGMSGLGKTHLMQSVAHRYQKAGRKFCYFTSDGFQKKVGQAFLTKSITEFKKSVSQAELLIIDDVHLLPNKEKPKTAAVLLEMYDEFTQHGKRVILASDRLPSQMEGFDPRFLSRFSEGLTVIIDPPEIETRVHILERKAASVGLELPKECAIFIAQNIPPDVRRLEGALNQVRAQAQVEGSAVDISIVRQALKSVIVARSRSINSDSIKDMVAEYYGVPVKELIGKKRSRHIARPRQMAMALIREFTGDSFPDIGQAFGGRDHTTVMHACEKVAELRMEDLTFDKDYKALSATLEFS